MLLVKEIKYQEAINFIMPRHYSINGGINGRSKSV